MKYNITDAGVHHLCCNNRTGVEDSEQCGCFYCCKIFPAEDVIEYVGVHKRNALCPRCGIDSVLPDVWIELSKGLLIAMKQRWFARPGKDPK